MGNELNIFWYNPNIYPNDEYERLLDELRRLAKTAKITKQEGFDLYTTTLTVSPHKNTTLVNMVRRAVAVKFEIPFLVADFKMNNGNFRSIELSCRYGMYRQDSVDVCIR